MCSNRTRGADFSAERKRLLLTLEPDPDNAGGGMYRKCALQGALFVLILGTLSVGGCLFVWLKMKGS